MYLPPSLCCMVLLGYLNWIDVFQKDNYLNKIAQARLFFMCNIKYKALAPLSVLWLN